jgi:hypothetical protein
MHNLKILTIAVALVFVTPVLAQEMGGATGPGSANGFELLQRLRSGRPPPGPRRCARWQQLIRHEPG